MGYIPSILVIVGFCFLWAMVNFSSLKSRREALKSILEKIKAIAAERNRIIQALLNEVTPIQLSNLNIHVFEDINAYQYSLNNNFHKMEVGADNWIRNLYERLVETGYPKENLQLLLSTSRDLRKQLDSYSQNARELNKLIQSRPSSFIATIFNFRAHSFEQLISYGRNLLITFQQFFLCVLTFRIPIWLDLPGLHL